MFALHSEIKDYAWGPRDGIAALLGTEPTGGPEAELWVGGHPSAPSRRADDGRALDELIADDPDALLGGRVTENFGPRLPFLLKVLAIGAPLSLQVHPTAGRAVAMAARYTDPYAKPEVLVALRDTWALAGLRPAADARELVALLDRAELGPLLDALDGEDRTTGLRHLLRLDDRRRASVASVAAAGSAAVATAADADPYRWVCHLARLHPGDPMILAPLLCGLHHLAAGEGIFLGPGVPHAYLEGAGVEMMGASDNVLRAGLTPKLVDAAEVDAVLDPTGEAVILGGEPNGPGRRRYRPGVSEIELTRIGAIPGRHVAAPASPAVGVVTSGYVTLSRPTGEGLDLASGGTAFIGVGDPVTVRGSGSLWWGTVAP